MKHFMLLILLGTLVLIGCAKEEPQPPTTPTATNAQPVPGMQGAQFRIPPRGAALGAPASAAGAK